MPDRIVELDGVQHHFPGDASDAEIAAALKGSAPAAPPVDRGGVRHPLTSVMAPELEGARSALNAATEAPHGQPIMARSRTGTLYPSEEGTGAVNAAKGAARGAGGALIDQAEGITSPLGLVTAGAAKGVSTLLNSPSARDSTGKVMQFIGNDLVDLRKPLKVVAKAGKWLQGTAAEAPELPPPAPTGPHMDLSTPIQAGSLTPQQIGERIRAVSAAGGIEPTPPVQKPMLGGRLQMAPTDRPPITVSPESPMQAPRAQVGAEVVGRQNGLTTQAVRDATGPIRGEAPGTAAGMPSAPKDRILGKLIDMGPKGQGLPESAREAYAAAGTSDKTRLQVQAYLDALRKVGFAAPLAVPSVRELLMKKLGQESQ